ncbi:MAG: phosphatidylglycerol lysyltransferase domain-containing protein [Verrucomicrobia bacterium]|nr:phosphatidylglycerol lysyltransferase domain-containing protein [Verrucomicrobiota bacterium]
MNPASSRSARWVPRALGIMVGVVGLFHLEVAIFPDQARYLKGIDPWTPFHIHFGSRALLLITGLSLLALGRGIARRKRAAWGLAVGALAAGPVLSMGLDFSWKDAVGSAVPLGVLFFTRHYFNARSDAGSLRFALKLAGAGATMLLIFGWVVLENFRVNLEGRDDALARVQAVAELVFLQSSDTIVARTTDAQTALYAISFAGAGTILLVILSALRPVLPPARASVREIERVRRIVQTYGHDPLDEFALTDDKLHFFTRDGQSVVAYGLWRNFALTLADPIGPEEHRAAAIREFIIFCDQQDWEPVFYEVGPDALAAYRDEGFITFKIGEGTTVDLTDFALNGRKYQDLRTARSRAVREGLSLRWLQPGSPLEPALAEELRAVSDGWLERKKGGEMAFDMGAYSQEEIEARGAVLAVRADGRVEAFATWLPYCGGQGRCIDLMRSRPEIPSVMDFVIVESLLAFQSQGLVEASLANAPLANIDPPSAKESKHDKAVRYFYERFNRLYGYKSLFHFKQKYHPQWRGRYLAYRHPPELPLIACAMLAVHSPGGLWKLLRS